MKKTAAQRWVDRYDAAVAPFLEELRGFSKKKQDAVTEELGHRMFAAMGVQVFKREDYEKQKRGARRRPQKKRRAP